jgi:hypothetical protein
MQAGNGYWEEPDPGGLAVIVVGVIIAVMTYIEEAEER